MDGPDNIPFQINDQNAMLDDRTCRFLFLLLGRGLNWANNWLRLRIFTGLMACMNAALERRTIGHWRFFWPGRSDTQMLNSCAK